MDISLRGLIYYNACEKFFEAVETLSTELTILCLMLCTEIDLKFKKININTNKNLI